MVLDFFDILNVLNLYQQRNAPEELVISKLLIENKIWQMGVELLKILNCIAPIEFDWLVQ